MANARDPWRARKAMNSGASATQAKSQSHCPGLGNASRNRMAEVSASPWQERSSTNAPHHRRKREGFFGASGVEAERPEDEEERWEEEELESAPGMRADKRREREDTKRLSFQSKPGRTGRKRHGIFLSAEGAEIL